MDISDLKGKLVAVLGFGQEGKSTAAYLLKHGIKPVLFDHKPWGQWTPEQQEEIKALGVNFIFGPDCLIELKGFDVVFRSPGIPLLNVKGQMSKVALTSQTKWFFEHCPCKIIGITGTKGKGTTSTLVYEILKLSSQRSKFKVQMFLTGNIGKTQALEFLDTLSENDTVVYELSSFQLQDLEQSPHIAVTLMVTQDHLDHHKNVEEYHEAKASITKFQGASDISIFNIDYPASEHIGSQGNGKKIRLSTKTEVETGCFVRDGSIVAKNVFENSSITFPTKNFRLRGRHNWENFNAAIAVSGVYGVSADIVLEVINNFKGLEHRLEFVAEKNGVKYYNDSISSVPETAIAAINSFTEPEIIILGGSTKHSNFESLGRAIVNTKNIKAIVLVGQEAPRIKQALEGAGKFGGAVLEGATSMDEILNQAKSVSIPGDVVVLSPACASFDMFKNYADRGNQFKRIVQTL